MAKSLEVKKTEIESLICQNSKVQDASHVAVNVKSTGFLFFKKESLVVSGRVNRDTDKEAVLAIIAEQCPDTELEDKLRVEHR